MAPHYSCSQSGWDRERGRRHRTCSRKLSKRDCHCLWVHVCNSSRIIAGRARGGVGQHQRELNGTDEVVIQPICREPAGDTPNFSPVFRLRRHTRTVNTSVSDVLIIPNILGIPSCDYNCQRSYIRTHSRLGTEHSLHSMEEDFVLGYLLLRIGRCIDGP